MAAKYRKLSNGLYMKVLNSYVDKYIAFVYPSDPNKPIDAPWNEQTHNPDGPAFIRYDTVTDNKTQKRRRYKSLEVWRIDGAMHREDGPARVQFNSFGLIRSKEWFQAGIRHNDFGPAQIEHRNGTFQSQKYFVKGKQIKEEQIDRFCEDWGLSDLSEMKTDKTAYAAFILEFY